jgi:hypothetical protein
MITRQPSGSSRVRVGRVRDEDREPSRRELRAIEAEWPAIAAELAIVATEVAAARGLRQITGTPRLVGGGAA